MARPDLEEGTWIIRSDDTKADRKHLVPLAPLVVILLDGLPQMGDYVFTSDGESHINGYATGKSKLDGFISGLKGDVEPWRFHDLRRTAATHMVRANGTVQGLRQASVFESQSLKG